MFQTVGHGAVDGIARCCGVPLFRGTISENEDLVIDEVVEVLAAARKECAFEAVSVGAIASSYQQIRVDTACARLGLRTLSYLWQRPQPALLHEICTAPLDVRVVKVAGMGLNGSHLGEKLSDLEQTLMELHKKWGLHPCGEGGEYETFVLDAPFFRNGRLEMRNVEKVQHSVDDVWFLKFEVEFVEEPKDLAASECLLPVPPLLNLEELGASTRPKTLVSNESGGNLGGTLVGKPAINQTQFAGGFDFVFKQLNEFLPTIKPATHVVVVLREMSRFAEMNALYVQAFGSMAPSRVCVECSFMEEDVRITVLNGKVPDRAVHVQGLSFWAPASIGPYAQCQTVDGCSFAAGQIGLVPQTLQLAPPNEELELALQNALRVLNAAHGGAENWAPRLCVLYLTDATLMPKALELFETFFKLPVLTCLVSGLPRGARYEWVINACDLVQHKHYIPATDEEDLLYANEPELTVTDSGFIHKIGMERVVVSGNGGPEQTPWGAVEPLRGAVQPARALFLGRTELNKVYISFRHEA